MLEMLRTFLLNRRTWGASTSRGKPLSDLVKNMDVWREKYNPLKGLNTEKAIALRDAFLSGNMADVQWHYRMIEGSDPDLFALVERRTSAIMQLDWNIKLVDKNRITGWDESLANEQQAALREVYERIDNIFDAVEHLTSATFRGFAHLERHGDSGGVNHLEVLDQWNVVRDGFRGQWKINPEAAARPFDSLPDEYLIDPSNWIIRTVPRHIDWIGLVKVVRSSLCEKDWDAFCEIYGVPGAVVVGPPQVPDGKEAEFQTAAEQVAQGGSGYLPNGSSVEFPRPRGEEVPFKVRLEYLREQLVLAGTGGLLTMLTAPTGIGKGPSEEHSDVFEEIARKESKQISSCFQMQFDKSLLAELFPGKPVLAYFELAANEESDPGEVLDHAIKIKQAGFKMRAEELSEKTGYSLDEQEPEPKKRPGLPMPDASNQVAANNALSNSSGASRVNYIAQATARDLQPVRKRLERILAITDEEIFRSKLLAFREELPVVLRDLVADPDSAHAIERQLVEAFFDGLTKDRRTNGQ